MKKNPQSMRILHLSDIHIKNNPMAIAEFDRRVKSLLEDIEQNFNDIDCLAISGDLTQSGRQDEFELLHSHLIDPLCRRLYINNKKILLVPGNHDINRAMITEMEQSGLKNTILDTEKAGDYICHEWIQKYSQNYWNYIDNNFRWARNSNNEPYFSTYVDFQGVKIGFSCLNTAWGCLDDVTQKKIFLSHKQVSQQISAVDAALIKIAIMHHGFDWLHPDEDEKCIIDDIKSNYDIILSGHVHQDISAREITPSSETINFTGMAFFEGKIKGEEGYNIYDINYIDSTITAFYRKYIRRRAAYDKNIEHASDGLCQFSLRKKMLPVVAQKHLAIQHLGSAVSSRLQSQLTSIQGISNPIFVSPCIAKVRIDNGQKKSSECSEQEIEKIVTHHHLIVYGPSEYGKTIFLENLSVNLSINSVFVYLDFRNDYAGKSYTQIVQDKIITLDEKNITNAVFILDHLSVDKKSIREIIDFFNTINKKCIVSISNEFLFDSICNNSEYDDIEKIQIKPWSLSIIKQFAIKYLKEKNIFDNNMVRALQYNFEHCDLPLTPVVISMYLSMFSIYGDTIKGISLSSLIERIENIKLISDIYNLRIILKDFAKLLYTRKVKSVSKVEFETLIKNYFEDKNLLYKLDDCVSTFLLSGLIKIDDGKVSFSYYVFYDFYIARALVSTSLDINAFTSNINSIIRNSDALAIYGALERDDEQTLEDFVLQIMETFDKNNHGSYSLTLLDRFIDRMLCSESVSDEDADRIAQQDISEQEDCERLENEFQENRVVYQRNRSQSIDDNDDDDDGIEFISKLIMALKAFYNLLRNLENISGKRKEEYLNLILDYHIYCNFMLIAFFKEIAPHDKKFQSMTAYLFTMGGQSFLSREIWSPNLRVTIENCIEKADNDFKKYLLICLYSEGRFAKYVSYIEDFVEQTMSRAALEMLYYRVREMMITSDSKDIPASLIVLFKKIYNKRKKYSFVEKITISDEIIKAQKSHSLHLWRKNINKSFE